jgi:hypothetical protein
LPCSDLGIRLDSTDASDTGKSKIAGDAWSPCDVMIIAVRRHLDHLAAA